MDRELKKQGLVVLDAREWLSFEKNVSARLYASRFHFRFPRTADLVRTPEEVSGFLFRTGLDPLPRPQSLTSRLTDLSASRISDIFGTSPSDLKDSHLHALLAKGHFGSPHDEVLANYDTKKVPKSFQSRPLPQKIREKSLAYDPRLSAIGFLITRNLVTEDLVEIYLPEISYAEFHRYQSKIHREIEATLPKTKIRTPVTGLQETIVAWERGRYDPDHNGVGSPCLAHMTAIPPERTSAALSRKNQKIAKERIRKYEETGTALSAAECSRRQSIK
jgi:hypothetical protein